MFCHKCGIEVSDGAAFCHKCGAKMESVDTTPQMKDIPATTSRPKTVSGATTPMPPPIQNIQVDTPKKKKAMKLPIILGAVALVIVAIIVIAMNWNGKIDYEATVRAYTPYANSQGLPYNCGEVFDKYIPNATWKIRNSGDLAYVDISGTAKGTEKELVIAMQVETANDHTSINPVSVKVDGRETSTQKETEMVFFAFFVAYDEKYDDLSNFDELLNEIEFTLQGDVDLPETYTNDTAGISFDYPSGWVVLDSDEEFEVVEMIDSQNNADGIAGFKVFSILDQDPLGVFSKDEASIREAVNEFGTFIKLESTLIGDVPTKGLMYQQAGLKGDDIVTNFWYFIGNELHQITCSYSASKADIYEPIFNAIMDSYKITAANTSGESGTANVNPSSVSYKGISIGSLFGSTDDVISLLGDSPLNDEIKLRYDDMEFYHDNGTITSLVSFDPSIFEADGVTLNKNREGLIKIFGQPSEEGGEKGSYSMTFNLSDCSIYFELGEPDSEAWRISISPAQINKDNNTSATATSVINARDFVGTYSYDASFEDPNGKWVNHYYSLEIGLDGSDLVVTQTWRGNYLFDHVNVSQSSITGNTLAFDAITYGSTESQTYSLTYIPAKDSPSEKDTIYIDDDETMPFVRE